MQTLFAIAAMTLMAFPAWAYLDPGSGSMLLQLILGGLAGLAVAGKLFWQRIVSFFSFGRDTSEPEQARDSEAS